MKKCMHKIENMPLQSSSIFSRSWQTSQSACFSSIKSSVWLYSDKKPRACQKLGVAAPGQRKICKCPTPGIDKAGKCPAVAWGDGGLGAAEIDWCVRPRLQLGETSNNLYHICEARAEKLLVAVFQRLSWMEQDLYYIQPLFICLFMDLNRSAKNCILNRFLCNSNL